MVMMTTTTFIMMMMMMRMMKMMLVILIVIQMTHTMIVTVIDIINKLYLCMMHLIKMFDIEIDMNQKTCMMKNIC